MYLLYILIFYLSNCNYYSCEEKSIEVKNQYKSLLKTAIEKKDINSLKFLMTRMSITAFYRLNYNWILLQEGIESKDIDIAKFLLNEIKNINEPLYQGASDTILDYLIEFKDSDNSAYYDEIIKIVKDKGGKPLNELNKKLYDAILKEDKTQINLLLKEGATITDAFNTNIDENVSNFKLFKKYGLNYNKLFPVVKDLKKDKWYLDEIINKNNVNQFYFGIVPLMSCIVGENIDLFLYLIEKGADINIKCEYNESQYKTKRAILNPLRVAIIYKKLNFAEILLQKDAVVEDVDIINAIDISKELVLLLLKYNVSFKIVYFDYNMETTPLITTIQGEKYDIASLIAKSSYLNYIDKENKTALDYLFDDKSYYSEATKVCLKEKQKYCEIYSERKVITEELFEHLLKLGAKRGCEMRNEKCE